MSVLLYYIGDVSATLLYGEEFFEHVNVSRTMDRSEILKLQDVKNSVQESETSV